MSEPGKAVFLSYTSQDAEAARRLCEGLRAAGLEVWFDQSELRGGDAWDAAIRRQIKTCALFIPLISASVRERTEGYFRLEWKLAVDRSHLMAAEKTFLLPVAIDATSDADSAVPERFREVQWTRLPGGEPTSAFIERVARLLAVASPMEAGAAVAAAPRIAPLATPESAEHPTAVPGASTATPAAPRTSPKRLWAIGALVVLALVGAGWLIQHRLAASARIVPYSVEDRRMTFAILPIQADPQDPGATKIAHASGDLLITEFEEQSLWGQLASQASLTRALAKSAEPRDVARALNVHFLIRGSVGRDGEGYTLKLFTLDGATERVLGSHTLTIPPDAVVPRWKEDVTLAVWSLMFSGMTAEVAAARGKPDEALDVRDLTFRAFVEWVPEHAGINGQGAYTSAADLLKRALLLAPDDALAIRATADINLCDCVEGWSTNVAQQQSIGAAAVDKYLSLHPNDFFMMEHKAEVYQLRGRYQESLVLANSLLERAPDESDVETLKAVTLLHLGRPKEAQPLAKAVADRYGDRWPETLATLAAIDYALADYVDAEHLAQQATTKMTAVQLRNPNVGAVQLTLIAAAGRLHDEAEAKAAIGDLSAAVPGIDSIGAARKWLYSQADLYGYEPLFEGLKLAGMRE
jgi:tetratricopeptide (TPR) repeat protein/TolB-like protein